MPSSYTIGEHYEALARELVASGRYASVSEVLRDSMRLLEEREALRAWKLEALKKAIAEGEASGDSLPWESADGLIAEGRRILAERAKRDAA